MSLITLAQALAKNVGVAVPATIVANSDRTAVEIMQFANEAGEEVARRVDWGVLQKAATLTGDGTNKTHTLPTDFSRMLRGACMTSGASIVRPLSQGEFSTLTPAMGSPRYFLLTTSTAKLWPYLANAATATVFYLSTNWASGGAAFMNDADTALIDEDLLLKALIVRWRRQKGMAYQDEEAEYEAALADHAKFDDRGRF